MIRFEPIILSSHGVAHSGMGVAFLGGIVILAMAVLFIVAGVYRLVEPLDYLWERQERASRARGLARVRNEDWERNARSTAVASLAFGTMTLLFGIWIAISLRSSSETEKMSGAGINGQKLTERQWEACRKEPIGCAAMYGNKGQ